MSKQLWLIQKRAYTSCMKKEEQVEVRQLSSTALGVKGMINLRIIDHLFRCQRPLRLGHPTPERDRAR